MTTGWFPLLFPSWKTPPDREGEIETTTGECDHRPQDADTNKPASGLVQVYVLEGGDGVDARRPPVLGEDNICKRDRCKSSAASRLARVVLIPLELIIAQQFPS